MPRLAIAIALLLLCVPAASADSTVTQNVPPGGSMSTGADATPADPVKVTLTSKQGGTYRIDTITSPTSRATPKSSYGAVIFPRAPQIVITPPCSGEGTENCPPYAVKFVIDSSVMPEPGNALFGVIGKDRLNTPAEITAYCSSAGTSSGCAIDDPLQRRHTNPDQPRHTMLANGDISIEDKPSGEWAAQPKLAYDFGHVSSRLSSNVGRSGDLTKLLTNKYEWSVFCNLLCETTIKLNVTSAIARKFKLASTTIGKTTFAKPGVVVVKLSASVRKKLRKAKRITVTASFSGEDAIGKSLTFKGTTVFTPAPQDG